MWVIYSLGDYKRWSVGFPTAKKNENVDILVNFRHFLGHFKQHCWLNLGPISF
jgi:hypothetical protein